MSRTLPSTRVDLTAPRVPLGATEGHGASAPRVGMVANTGFYLRQFRLGVLRGLRDAGHEVIVVTRADAHSAKLIAEGYHVEHVDVDSHGSSPRRDVQLALQLRRVYREHRLDVVFHHTIKPNVFGTMAARSVGIPSVAVLSGLGSFADLPRGPRRTFVNALYRWAASAAAEVWFLNAHDRGYFEGRGWLDSTPTSTLKTEGIDLDHFAYREMPRRRPGTPLQALFAGRLLYKKGVAELVAAARLLRERGVAIEVSLLGPLDPHNPDSVAAGDLRSWTEAGDIRYLGEVVDVRGPLQRTDIVVQPTRYREGKSRILTEAMATGRAIVTTDRPGAGELVEQGVNGYLVAENDARGIARALEAFAGLSDLERERMGVAGRRIAERDHDQRTVIRAYRAAVGRLTRT